VKLYIFVIDTIVSREKFWYDGGLLVGVLHKVVSQPVLFNCHNRSQAREKEVGVFSICRNFQNIALYCTFSSVVSWQPILCSMSRVRSIFLFHEKKFVIDFSCWIDCQKMFPCRIKEISGYVHTLYTLLLILVDLFVRKASRSVACSFKKYLLV
jgi:hypothetical protein